MNDGLRRLVAARGGNGSSCGRMVKAVLLDGRVYPLLAALGEGDKLALRTKLGPGADLSRVEVYAASQPNQFQ